jgi:hypothetical protein
MYEYVGACMRVSVHVCMSPWGDGGRKRTLSNLPVLVSRDQSL